MSRLPANIPAIVELANTTWNDTLNTVRQGGSHDRTSLSYNQTVTSPGEQTIDFNEIFSCPIPAVNSFAATPVAMASELLLPTN